MRIQRTTIMGKSCAHEVFAHHFRLSQKDEEMAHFNVCYAFA